MANEYSDLATIHDVELGAKITVRRMYQEDGSKGIEINVEDEGGMLSIFQTRDIVLHDSMTRSALGSVQNGG